MGIHTRRLIHASCRCIALYRDLAQKFIVKNPDY